MPLTKVLYERRPACWLYSLILQRRLHVSKLQPQPRQIIYTGLALPLSLRRPTNSFTLQKVVFTHHIPALLGRDGSIVIRRIHPKIVVHIWQYTVIVIRVAIRIDADKILEPR
jgi:hypothetical protein